MRLSRLLGIAALTLAGLVLWSLLAGFWALKGYGRVPLASHGDAGAFVKAVQARIDAESSGNAAFLLLEEGEVYARYETSVGEPVDDLTLFQVASVSKWITAWGVMKLVEDGKIDLDAPVSTYLTRWTLPESRYDADEVTVRRLLSHTAGLTDGLGYMGFAPGAQIQSLEQSLTRAADAAPLLSGEVRMGAAPGSEWRYSGGGYTMLQLIIEEVTGESFSTYMKAAILDPLGMTGSTFSAAPDDPHLADFYDTDGSIAPHYQYTAKAAASLHTSTADLSRFLRAHLTGPDGAPPGRGVLSPGTLEDMRRPQGFLRGVPVWGLGLVLYTPTASGGYLIGHDGSNAPAIGTSARLDPATGDGIVVLSTGTASLATDIADEWILWQTGEVSPMSLNLMNLRSAVVIAMGGPSRRDLPELLVWLAGAGLIIVLAVRAARKRKLPT